MPMSPSSRPGKRAGGWRRWSASAAAASPPRRGERALEIIEELIFRVAREEGVSREDYLCGTMIELPRACFLADTIATHADFFSFGTNDLTQTALGFSRDDIEGKILAPYIESKVFDRSPFETLDTPGVGQLVRMGAWLGRKAKPELKLGVCGEHGGDPASVAFCHDLGLALRAHEGVEAGPRGERGRQGDGELRVEDDHEFVLTHADNPPPLVYGGHGVSVTGGLQCDPPRHRLCVCRGGT